MQPAKSKQTAELSTVTFLGDSSSGGVYVLRLDVNQSLDVQFGRFADGRLIGVPAGEYLYVGSALTGMARRLLRHASRIDPQKPQSIRQSLLAHLKLAALLTDRFPPYPPKRLHWHIDYLVEKEPVTLTHIFILRCSLQLESAVADWLVLQPETELLAAGLGASDRPGGTHLLQVKANETWWLHLPVQLTSIWKANHTTQLPSLSLSQ